MPSHLQRCMRPQRTALWLDALILLTDFITRIIRLADMPVFIDESVHIKLARSVLHGFPYSALALGRWLHVFLLGLLDPSGVETLWLARYVSVLASVLACGTCLSLGVLLGNRLVGRMAALLYLVTPFVVFYDRQAMNDTLLISLGSLSLIFTVRLVRSQSWRFALPLGLALGAVALTKLSGIMFLPLALVGPFILGGNWAERRRAMPPIVTSVAVGAGLTLSILYLANLSLPLGQSPLSGQYDSSNFCPPATCGGAFSPQLFRVQLAQNWERASQVMPYYYGLPLMLGGVVGLSTANRRNWREVSYLGLAVLYLGGAVMVITDLFPRYLLPTLPPLTVLAAIGVVGLSRWIGQRCAPASTLIGGVLAAGLLLYPVQRDYRLTFRPSEAGLPPFEERAPDTRPPAVGKFVKEWLRTHPGPAHVVTTGLSKALRVYWGPRIGYLVDWGAADNQIPQIAGWLNQGETVFLIDVPTELTLPDFGAITETRYLVPANSVGGEMRIREIVEARGELLNAIRGQRFLNPSALAEDYARLAGVLSSAAPSTAVVMYPPHQIARLAPLVSGDPNLDLIPLADSWPQDFDAARADLEQSALNHDWLLAVFLQETAGDPERSIETWLARHLFAVSEQWFGPVRLATYATLPRLEAVPRALGVHFGDPLELDAATLYDPQTRPGGLIRIQLTWRSLAKTDQSFKIFVHIFSHSDEFAAQHDGIPQAGLAPTNTWTPNQLISDQFAVSLPTSLSPGTYSIRVGVFDPVSGARLPAAPPADAPDYVTVGEIEVR